MEKNSDLRIHDQQQVFVIFSISTSSSFFKCILRQFICNIISYIKSVNAYIIIVHIIRV